MLSLPARMNWPDAIGGVVEVAKGGTYVHVMCCVVS